MHFTANIRQITLIIAACALSFFCQAAHMPAAYAQEKAETWEALDKRLKSRVFQLNVAVKFRLKNGFAHLTDLSPKYRYPVFGTSADDKGFRVVGSGSSFPIQTLRNDKRYFLTNRHVVTTGDNLAKECERFFAALRFYAQQTAGFGDPENRYRDLLNIVNLSQKKDMSLSEKVVYQSTVDGVWDTYENSLSVKADPSRVQFQKYLAQAGLVVETGFFLHPVGPVTQPSLQAQLYKAAKSDNDPDLALLSVNNLALPVFEFENVEPSEGQEIQVIGYPLASDQIDFDSGSYYTPTFSTGRISRVAPRFLQVDAPVSVGNSGGPVVSQRGKVLGVVVRRASFQQKLGTAVIQTELPNFAGAIAVQSIKGFAPELFN